MAVSPPERTYRRPEGERRPSLGRLANHVSRGEWRRRHAKTLSPTSLIDLPDAQENFLVLRQPPECSGVDVREAGQAESKRSGRAVVSTLSLASSPTPFIWKLLFRR